MTNHDDQLQRQFKARETLLRFNSGIWDSLFIRFNAMLREQERFSAQLQVKDQGGEIVAALKKRNSKQLREMRFREPPSEMQITANGNWSLGPVQLAASRWVTEICLCHGHQRRRAVFHHDEHGLESAVVIVEARQGKHLEQPEKPAQLKLLEAQADQIKGQQVWQWGKSLGLIVMAERSKDSPQSCGLRWCPEPGEHLELMRSYSSSGRLKPIGIN